MIVTFSKDYVPLQTPELDVRAAVAKISGLYADNLRADITWARGRRVRFVIRAKNSRTRGARLSASGRYTVGASWEAHRDVMLELFDRDNGARLYTGIATYRGRADFLAKFEATAFKNIGSQMFPCTIRECSIW